MKQSVSYRKSGWFWVGVVLLSLSTLFWLMPILMIVGEPEEAASLIGDGLLLSAVLIGIDIYCVRRGRKATTVTRCATRNLDVRYDHQGDFQSATGIHHYSSQHVPLLLWFLRTKRISRDEAKSVFLHSVQRMAVSDGGKEGGEP